MSYDTRKIGPMRRVVNAELRAGGSILQPGFKHHWWQLTLDCGHTVERRIRWLRRTDGYPPLRGWSAQWQGPSLDRLPDEPKRARCDQCARDERRAA